MMLQEIVLMVMLTGGGNAPLDASFIEVETKAECEERAARAIAVFPAADITYSAHYCVRSAVRFEFFAHNDVPTGPHYYFGLTFSGDGERLTSAHKFASMEACEGDHTGSCVLSYQDILVQE